MVFVYLDPLVDDHPCRVLGNEERLFEAVENLNVEKVERIVRENNVDVNALRKIYRYGRIIRYYGAHTVLGLSVKNGYPAVVEALLRHPEIDVNVASECWGRYTPLHNAVHNVIDRASLGEDRWTILNLVLADDRVNVNVTDEFGNTPLHVASDNPRAIEALLARNADPNKANNYGNTPLHVAMHDPKAVRALLRGNANPNKQNADGATPLHRACKINYFVHPRELGLSASKLAFELAFGLLEGGADPMARDKIGNTSLHEACRRNCVEVVGEILCRVERARDKVDLLEMVAGRYSWNKVTALDVAGDASTGSRKQSATRRCVLRHYREAIVQQYGPMCVHAIMRNRVGLRRSPRRQRREDATQLKLSIGVVSKDDLRSLLQYFYEQQPSAVVVPSDDDGTDSMLPAALVAARIDWPVEFVYDMLRRNPEFICRTSGRRGARTG